MASFVPNKQRLDPEKFKNPFVTAKGEPRAHVDLRALKTLWFNTGTLCNIACANCYIESSPRNDRLVYIRAAEVATYLDEIERDRLGTDLIGFTGGEPFMNPEIIPILDETLWRGFNVMVLTNAMKPMHHKRRPLLELRKRYGERLVIRVSIDHYTQELHEQERGPRSWDPTIVGLRWLAQNGFRLNIAGRLFSGEPETVVREGYGSLLAEHGVPVDAQSLVELVLFPEMDETVDVPEITDRCWGILNVPPEAVMCATSRMVIKRKGADRPSVVSCTLLPYDPQFEMGHTLADASGRVWLNHPHCAKFCVLGGASCAAG